MLSGLETQEEQLADSTAAVRRSRRDWPTRRRSARTGGGTHLRLRRGMERGRQASDAGSSTRNNQGRRRGKPSLGAWAGYGDFKAAKAADPRPGDEGEGLRILPHKADPLLNVSLPEGAETMQRFGQVSGFIGFAADWKPSFFPLQAPYFRTSLFKPYRRCSSSRSNPFLSASA